MKRKLIIIIVSVLVFLFFNFVGSFAISSSGQTNTEIALGYLAYAIWGLIFGFIFIVVDMVLTRKKK